MARVVIVVPCLNEEKRLDPGSFARALRRMDELHIVFVDDGSRDGTRAMLESLVADVGGDRADLIPLERNVGKAEAVRLGVARALEAAPFAVGFWDADLSTPLENISSFANVLHAHPETMAVIGSRVRLMGAIIERKASRHYAGRVFATFAALTLGFPVYDTQCGAKLFRVTPRLRAVLDAPFRSRWAFDVEVLARLAELHGMDLGDRGVVVEFPLTHWADVAGSRVRFRDLPGMAADLLRIFRGYRGARRAGPALPGSDMGQHGGT